MPRPTPNYNIPVPENPDKAEVADDMWAMATAIDANLFEVADNAVAIVQDTIDEALEPVRDMISDSDPSRANWDDAVYSAGVFENDRASFLEVRADGTPTDFSATGIGQSLERIGWAGSGGGGSDDLTQARSFTLATPPEGPATDAAIASFQAGVNELVARIPTEGPGMDPIPIPDSTTADVRTPGGIALCIATALVTGTYNSTDMTEAEATGQVVRFAMSPVATHLVNSETPVWGTNLPPRNAHGSAPAQQNQWQSAYWAMNAAMAAWLVWPHLTVGQREQVGRMVVHEADRMLNWTPPYWRDQDGTDTGRGGDSAAEAIAIQENSLAIALAMYPDHPRARRWMDALLKQHLAATSAPQDIGRVALTSGLVVGEQTVNGYNLTADYEIENHGMLPHPFYWGQVGAAGTTMGNWLAMAGLPVPQTLLHNARNMWTTATTKNYPSPPYNEPGGVVFPGDGTFYGPDNNDRRPDQIPPRRALLSMVAELLGWDTPFALQASAVASIQSQDIPLYQTASTAMGQVYRRAEHIWHLFSPAPQFSSQPAPYLLESAT